MGRQIRESVRSRLPYVPALLLAAGVTATMLTPVDDAYAFDAIFGAFVGGLLVVGVSVVAWGAADLSTSRARAGLAMGGSLAGAAVLSYLVFGCVLGCPA